MGNDISRINATLLYRESIEEKINRFGSDVDDL